jgi:hypothetical protein
MASAASRLLTVLAAAREGAKVGVEWGVGWGGGKGGAASQGAVIRGALERRAGRTAAELARESRVVGGVYTRAHKCRTGNLLLLICKLVI